MRRDTYTALEKVADVDPLAAIRHGWEALKSGARGAGDVLSGLFETHGYNEDRVIAALTDESSDAYRELQRFLRNNQGAAAKVGLSDTFNAQLAAYGPGGARVLQLIIDGKLDDDNTRRNVGRFLQAARTMQGWRDAEGNYTAAGRAAAMSDTGYQYISDLYHGLRSSADDAATSSGTHLLDDPNSNDDYWDQVRQNQATIDGVYNNYANMRRVYRLQQAPISTALGALFSSDPQDMYSLVDAAREAFTPGSYIYDNFVRGNPDFEKYGDYIPWLHFAGNLRSLFDTGNFSRYPSLFTAFTPGGGSTASTEQPKTGDAKASPADSPAADSSGNEQASNYPSYNTGILTNQDSIFPGETYRSPVSYRGTHGLV